MFEKKRLSAVFTKKRFYRFFHSVPGKIMFWCDVWFNFEKETKKRKKMQFLAIFY